MTPEKEDFEEENEKLSEIFDNQVDDDEEFEADFDLENEAIEAEFTEHKRKPAPKISTRGAIQGEIMKDEFAAFLETLPPNTEITIIVNRKPDHNLHFRIPNKTYGHTDTLYWNNETTEEIYADIQKRFGGGRYQFQIRHGKGFSGKTWEKTIFDPHEPSDAEKVILAEKEKAKAQEHERKSENSQSFANQPRSNEPDIDNFFDTLEKWEKRIEKFRPKENPPMQVSSERSVEDIILLEAVREVKDDEVKKQLVQKVFGLIEEKKQQKETWIDLVKYGLQNFDQVKNVIGGVASIVLPYVLPASSAQPPMTAGNLPNFPNMPGQAQPNLEQFRQKAPVEAAPVSEPQAEQVAEPQAPPAKIELIEKVEW